MTATSIPGRRTSAPNVALPATMAGPSMSGRSLNTWCTSLAGGGFTSSARAQFPLFRRGDRERRRFGRKLAESQRAFAVEDGVIARHARGGRDLPAPGRRGDEHGARGGAGLAQGLVSLAGAGRTVGLLIAVSLVGVALLDRHS